MAIEEGQAFPEVEVETPEGGRAKVRDLAAGRPAVIYFYPKDSTPGCTVEAHEFQAALADFQAAGVAVFGCSVDDQGSHASFAAECSLAFPLLADGDGALSAALGIRNERGMSKRTTYLLAGDGRVRRVWADVRPQGHALEVLAAARG